jgi:uncharacterized protein YoxC
VRRVRIGTVDLSVLALAVSGVALLLTLIIAYALSLRIDTMAHTVGQLSKDMSQMAQQLEVLNQKVAELIRYSPYFTG